MIALAQPAESLEVVEWRDAYFVFENTGEDAEREDYIVTTVGWVTERPLFLRVVMEKLPEDDGDRAVTYIPNEMVIRRTNLTET